MKSVHDTIVKKIIDLKEKNEYTVDDIKDYKNNSAEMNKLLAMESMIASDNKVQSFFKNGKMIWFDAFFILVVLNSIVMFSLSFLTLNAEPDVQGQDMLGVLFVSGLLAIISIGLAFYSKLKVSGSIVASVVAGLSTFNILIMIPHMLFVVYHCRHPFFKQTIKQKREARKELDRMKDNYLERNINTENEVNNAE